MSSESNFHTRKVLSNEIKALQARCVEYCDIIDNNAPMGIHSITPSDAFEKKLGYVNNLAKNIQKSETPIITDSNVNTSQYCNEMKEKIVQVEELNAFNRGTILDVDNEIARLKHEIKIVLEAKSRPVSSRREIQPEHLQKAKHRFKTLKLALHGLINSLYPTSSEAMTSILGELMSEKMNETSSGYIPITSENYLLIELLKDKNIVTANPYNKREVKLTY